MRYLHPAIADRPRVLPLLRDFGADAISFLALESGMRHWFADGAARACVAYVDTGRVWVAAGRPLAEPHMVAAMATAFLRAARAQGRSASFFATERSELEGFASVLLGRQPVWNPARWAADVARRRRMREQLRRARAKGVLVRRVRAEELDADSPLRRSIESLAEEWTRSRHMEPMAFLVALEPFHVPSEHRYYVAERGGRVVGFLSAVPIYARSGWLVEDLLRNRDAPNGTAEVLVDAMMRDAADSEVVTLGLAPLSGPVAPWLRMARVLTRPLYDFAGIESFKSRLRPSAWECVWLVYPRSEWPASHVVEALRAFADGPLFAFGLRTIVRHPSGPPWALGLPLVPWTVLLVWLVVTGRSGALGMTRAALLAWTLFDAMLGAVLLRAARRPRPTRLACSTAAAGFDAVCSVIHVASTGLGGTIAQAALRSVSAIAPCFGAVVLAWATAQSIVRLRE